MTSQIVVANTGIYNIQFSSQMDKSDAGVDYVNFWLRRNGADITASSGVISLQGNSPAYMMAAWNYLIDLVGGDTIELYWASADINMSIINETAQTSPFAHPAVQSTILTVTQQSGIMAGTGITAINSLTGAAQTLTTGTSGTDFTISSSDTNHTFNLPNASATARGLITINGQTIAGAKTFSTAPILSSLTASQILALDASNNIQSLPVATYPSLTELSYVKGVTSAIQTQLNAKQPQINGTGFVKASGTSISYDNSIYNPIVINDLSTGSVTGTTVNTIVASYLINANTFKYMDAFNLTSYLYLNGNSKTGNQTLRFYFNSTVSLTGATLIATYTYLSTTKFGIFERTGTCTYYENLLIFPTATSIISDRIATTLDCSLPAFTFKSNTYLIVACQLSVSTDIGQLGLVRLTK
jgi:hypothetical protein